MAEVLMMVSGKPAMVPAEHAKKVARKQQLVAEAMRLNDATNNCSGLPRAILLEQRQKVMAKIIRLNRQIPPCVRFV
jgi:hypothetical protein